MQVNKVCLLIIACASFNTMHANQPKPPAKNIPSEMHTTVSNSDEVREERESITLACNIANVVIAGATIYYLQPCLSNDKITLANGITCFAAACALDY